MLRTASHPPDERTVVPPSPFYGTPSSSDSSGEKQKKRPATAKAKMSTRTSKRTPPQDTRTVAASQSSSSRKTRSQQSPSASPARVGQPDRAPAQYDEVESSLSPPASFSSSSDPGSDDDDGVAEGEDDAGSSGKRDQTSSSIDEPPSPAAHFGLPAGSPAASAPTPGQDRKKPLPAPPPTGRIPEVIVTTSNQPSRQPSPPVAVERPAPAASKRAVAPRMRATLSASAADAAPAHRGLAGAPMARARSGLSTTTTGARTVSAGARKGRAAELAAEEADLGGYRSSDSRGGRKRSRSPLVYTPRSRRMKTDAERQAVEAKRQKLLSDLEVEEGQMADSTHPLLVELEAHLDRGKEKRLELIRRKHEMAQAYLGRLNEERVERAMCHYLDEKKKLQTEALLEVQLKMRRLDSEFSLTDPLLSIYCPNNINLTLPPDPAPFLPVPNPTTLGPRDALPAHAIVAALDRRKVANHAVWRLRDSEAQADVAFLKSGGLLPLPHQLPPPPPPTVPMMLEPGPVLPFEEPRQDRSDVSGSSSGSGKEERKADPPAPERQQPTASSSDESALEHQPPYRPGNHAERMHSKRGRRTARIRKDEAGTEEKPLVTTTEEMGLLSPPQPSSSGEQTARERMDVDEQHAGDGQWQAVGLLA